MDHTHGPLRGRRGPRAVHGRHRRRARGRGGQPLQGALLLPARRRERLGRRRPAAGAVELLQDRLRAGHARAHPPAAGLDRAERLGVHRAREHPGDVAVLRRRHRHALPLAGLLAVHQAGGVRRPRTWPRSSRSCAPASSATSPSAAAAPRTRKTAAAWRRCAARGTCEPADRARPRARAARQPTADPRSTSSASTSSSSATWTTARAPSSAGSWPTPARCPTASWSRSSRCAHERAPLRVRVPPGRPEGRAGAGHHHRHGALLLQHAAAALHHPRRPGPRGVPQEHDHRRLARAGGAAGHRRATRACRENSQRHGYILSMLGIRQIGVLVNKMDLVDWDQASSRRSSPSTPTSSAGSACTPRASSRSARATATTSSRARRPRPGTTGRRCSSRSRTSSSSTTTRPAVPHAAAGRLQVHRGGRRPAHLRRHRRDRPRPPRRRGRLPALGQALDGQRPSRRSRARGPRRRSPGRPRA